MVNTGVRRPALFRPDIPSPARIYDYLLGGKDHYPADREAAEEIIALVPAARTLALQNREFRRRAVGYLAGQAGIRQFIDIGAGMPSQHSVHEIARHAAPKTRVVYVDNDPVVLAHGRAMLHGTADTAIIEQDLREPERLLADDELRKLIDFEEPAGLLLTTVLHFVADSDDPAELISELLGAVAPGSYLVFSHAATDGGAEVARALRVYERATSRAYARGLDHLRAMLSGLELVEPGLVPASQWRPGLRSADGGPHRLPQVYAAIARKPARSPRRRRVIGPR